MKTHSRQNPCSISFWQSKNLNHQAYFLNLFQPWIVRKGNQTAVKPPGFSGIDQTAEKHPWFSVV
jgi:hypothetical protein